MTLEAELLWTGERFERHPHVRDRRALLPGFVSAHSHAFQRALRGRGETFPAGSGSFWSWREAMYALVEQLDETRFYDAVRATFAEMLGAGITAVGEFHYFHHGAAKHALDEAILGAARDAGIRIVLLMTYYKTGGINQPLSPAQQRFATPSLSDFFAQLDALAKKLDTRTQSLGVAAHSIRGVPLEELQPLYLEARRRGMPFHMHVEEQCRELEESIAAYGATPLQLINERFASCEGFTAVHATHSDPAQLARFIEKGGSVCITPLTEANLGDGIPDVTALLPHPDRLSLGTDSNARISMLEEMRWLEYAQRLRSETRGVYRDANGRNAARLLQFATTSGARALGIDASSDFIAVDLDAPAIAAAGDEHLLEAIVFGAGDDVIRSTIVNGR